MRSILASNGHATRQTIGEHNFTGTVAGVLPSLLIAAFAWVGLSRASADMGVARSATSAPNSVATACAVPTFGPVTNFGVGTSPRSIATGDFNQDGVPDLATANLDSNNVSVLLGNGAGGFGSATHFGVGSSPRSLSVGVFDSDSNPDIAVANYNSNTVSILLGNGTGGFGAATDFAVGSGPYYATVGNFNSDSNLDLAAANAISNSISILLGDGSGGFGPAADFGVGFSPRAVAVGTFNEDSHSDLAVANFDSNNISVLLGDGNGNFGAATNYSVGTNPLSLSIGDFNEDSNADLAVVNYFSDNVSILLGNGSGGFNPPANYSVGTAPRWVAVSDFNLDSTYDLAVANGLSNNVSILLGNGAGGFGSATHFAVGTAPFSVAVDDFNNDTASDLATANFAANSVSVRLNICGAQTPTTTPTLSPTDTPVGATATPTATRTLLPTNSPTATVCAIQFSDVPTDHTFYVYIRCLVCRGIVSGYADNTFRPANEVTCGQIAKIVSNSAGYSEPPGPQIFEDVPPGHTFFEFVQRLAYRGILAGYPCGSDVEPCVPPGNLPYFRPANNASRGQLAKIACRAYNCVGIPAEQTFEDVPANHTFYTDVEQLHALGAINGYPCGNPEPCIPPLNRPYFRPSNTVTRGQTAKIVANVFFPDCYTPSMPRQR